MESAYNMSVLFLGGEGMSRKKIFLFFSAAAAMTYFLSGCGIDSLFDFSDSSRGSDYSIASESYDTQFSEPYEYANIYNDTKEDQEYSVKNTLNEDQTEIYNRLINMIENYELSFDFENTVNDDFKKAYYGVLYDHPEYFWLGQNYSYTQKSIGDYSTLHIEPKTFSNDTDEIRAAREKLEGAAELLAQAAKAQEDVFFQVKYVHDSIIDSTLYDSDAIELISSGKEYGLLNASTAYGCLVENKAICSGYSAAFQLVMQKLGIECGRVNGTRISESGSHQWNYLCLDGEYYYIDVTWDDPIKSDGEESKTYEYFLLSDSNLEYTHTADGALPVPVCSGTRYNYYRYTGLYFDEYNFGYIRAAADLLKDDSFFTVMFSSPEELQAAVDELIVRQHIFDIEYISGSISYSVSSSGCILTVYY